MSEVVPPSPGPSAISPRGLPELHKPVIAIVGPTAIGKSSLGLELASELGGEIVNADALQVYRGFDIGTAKPTPEERRATPHHLIDILEPTERCSAGELARRAHEAFVEIEARGRRSILVGGSGLYVRAILDGMSPIPPADPEVRSTLNRRLVDEGLAALREELAERDPETAARLAPGDRQRIQRALEVVLSSGRPLSSWIRERPFGQGSLPAVRIGLTLPRNILYDRIQARVRDMVTRGWIEEVKLLLRRGIAPDAPAFQAIGYRQLARHVVEGWGLGEALDDIVRETRRYAKRQMTWFRKEAEVRWIPAHSASDAIPSLSEELANGPAHRPGVVSNPETSSNRVHRTIALEDHSLDEQT